MNNKLTFSGSFFCVKLITGETLFSEILDADENSMMLYNPMLVLANDGQSFSITQWVPYTVNSKISIPMKIVVFADILNKQFFEYYGRSVLQQEIDKIKRRVFEEMSDRDDFVIMHSGLEEIKTISHQLSIKFGIDVPDFSEFETAIEKHKSNLVLH